MRFLGSVGTHDKLGSTGVDILLDFSPHLAGCTQGRVIGRRDVLAAFEWQGRKSLALPRYRLQKRMEPKLRNDPQGSPDQLLRRDCESPRCPPRLRSGLRTKPANRPPAALCVERQPCCGRRPKPGDHPFDRAGEATLDHGPNRIVPRRSRAPQSTVFSSARSLRRRVSPALLCAPRSPRSHANHRHRCRPQAKAFPCRENRA